MELRKYKKFYSFLIIGLIVFSAFNSFNQPIKETDKIIEEQIPSSSGDPTALFLEDDPIFDRESCIRMTHTKGTSDIFWSMNFAVISSSPSGSYSFTPRSIYAFNNLHFVSTGELNYQLPYIYFFNDPTPTTVPLYNNKDWINVGGRLDSYLLQTSGINDYSDTQCEFMLFWSDYDSSGQIQHTAPTSDVEFHLYWELHPICEFDSDYYNFANIRLEIYDKTNAAWLEQNPTDIILQHPEYKLRIYDAVSNNLIFEDLDYQFFKYYREISLDTLKIQNNAPEPINTTILENNHYKGAYSFDLDGVHTRPEYLEYSEEGTSYIINEKDDHDKVLFVDSNLSIDYGTHPDVENFDNGLAEWDSTDWSNVNSILTYNTEKNSKKHVLELMAGDTVEVLSKTTITKTETTFSAWMRAEAINKDKEFFFEDASDIRVCSIEMDASGIWKVWRNGAYVSLSESLVIDTWYHVVGFYDKSNVAYYINGNLVYSNPTTDNTDVDEFKILSRENNDGNHWFICAPYLGLSIVSAFSSLYSGTTITINETSQSATNGTFEFWQYQYNKACLSLSNISYNWNPTNICFTNNSDSYSIETENTNDAWNRYKIEWSANSISFYRNNNLLDTSYILAPNFATFTWMGDGNLYLDAIDYTLENSNLDFIEGQNQFLNSSGDLWCWEANPEWESGYYGFNETFNDWSDNSGNDCIVSLNNEFDEHKYVMEMSDESAIYRIDTTLPFSSQVIGTVGFWFQSSNTIEFSQWVLSSNSLSAVNMMVGTVDNKMQYYDGSYHDVCDVIDDVWYYIELVFNCSSDSYDIYIDGYLKISLANFHQSTSYVDGIRFLSSNSNNGYQYYIDGIGYSWDNSLRYLNANLLENTTFVPLDMEYYTTLVSPYSSVLTNYTQTNHLVNITDLYGNILEYKNLTSSENLITYTPPNVRTCLVLLSDQLSNSLNYLNYHIYLNNSALYEQNFYREINETVNISIYDRFDQHLTSYIYQVKREDNFINIELILYSLKILNQLHEATILNITNQLDPLDCVLSENIAVNELISLKVKEANYSIYYIDDSNTNHTLNFTVNESKLVILNTTYHEVHFAYFDMSGLGLDSQSARFYINSERRDIGKNWIKGDSCNLKVLDYFNATLYNDDISLSGLTEFNIYLPIFTLLINNNYTESMKLTISRLGIEFNSIIPAQSGLSFRFLANETYSAKIYYMNGTLADSKIVLLDENYKDISFGFYSEPVSLTPEDIQMKYQDFLLWGLFAIIALTVVSVLFIQSKRELEKTQPRKSKSHKRGIRNDNKTTMGGF